MSVTELEIAYDTFMLHVEWHQAALRHYANAVFFFDTEARRDVHREDGATRALMFEWQYAYRELRHATYYELDLPNWNQIAQHSGSYINSANRLIYRIDEFHGASNDVGGRPSFYELAADSISQLVNVSDAFSEFSEAWHRHTLEQGAGDSALLNKQLGEALRQMEDYRKQLLTAQSERDLAESAAAKMKQELHEVLYQWGYAELITVAQIAKRTGITQQAVSKRIASLVKRGWIKAPHNEGMIYFYPREATIIMNYPRGVKK